MFVKVIIKVEQRNQPVSFCKLAKKNLLILLISDICAVWEWRLQMRETYVFALCTNIIKNNLQVGLWQYFLFVHPALQFLQKS